MIESLPNDKLRELFLKVPEDLQDAIYAPETGEKVEGICERNRIEHLYDDLGNGIGDVYLGVLSPENFLADFNKKLAGVTGINQINLEINNFLLRPYQESLDKVYKMHYVAAGAQKDAKQPPQEQKTPETNPEQPTETQSNQIQ